MAKLKIIKHSFNSYNFQNYYIKDNSLLHCYKYALIPFSNDLKCICKMLPISHINEKFCYLENTVMQFSNLSILCNSLADVSNEYVKTEEIFVFKSSDISSSLVVTVVFKSIHKANIWKRNTQYLTEIIKPILMLFVVTNNCIISLKKLKYNEALGICYIIIHEAGAKRSINYTMENTVINIKDVISMVKFKSICSFNSDKVTGITEQYRFLTTIVKAHQFNKPAYKLCNKVLLIGPSGCGKTFSVHSVASELKTALVIIDTSQLANAFTGSSELILKQHFEEAKLLAIEDASGVCIILLDNVEIICPKHTRNARSHIKRLSRCLMRILDDIQDIRGLIVIATTNNIHIIDPDLRRANRLETEIYFGVPSETDRLDMLKTLCKNWANHSICKEIAACTPGYVVTDLISVIREVYNMRLRYNETSSNKNSMIEDFKHCIGKYCPSSLRCVSDATRFRKLQMDEIGGLSSVKLQLKSYIEWPLKHPEAFHKLKIPIPKGVLLYGPPGCAKTSLVCAIANSLNATFLSVSSAELYSPFVGVTEQNVSELFNRARVNSPAIVFIDEIDSLVGKRGEGEKDIRQNVLSSFLIEMDGVGNKIDICSTREPFHKSSQTDKDKEISFTVIVIGATNRPDKLDDAILRPGRFDKLLYVGPPNCEDRLNILQTTINNWKMPVSSCINLHDIAEKTDLYSGADLVNIIREAGFDALVEEGMNVESVKQQNFLAALNSVKSSLNTDQLSLYNSLNLNNTKI